LPEVIYSADSRQSDDARTDDDHRPRSAVNPLDADHIPPQLNFGCQFPLWRERRRQRLPETDNTAVADCRHPTTLLRDRDLDADTRRLRRDLGKTGASALKATCVVRGLTGGLKAAYRRPSVFT
jgi:hypothetical protein